MKKRKTWREKLADSKGLPKVVQTTPAMAKRWGAGDVLVPAPKEVNELMSQVPEGQVTTMDLLREALARRHSVPNCCPLTTGIFAWIAAHAAEESAAAGEKATPYWRTLKSGGWVNPKYPGGAEAAAKRLQAEGHHVEQRRGKFVVQDLDSVLYRFP